MLPFSTILYFLSPSLTEAAAGIISDDSHVTFLPLAFPFLKLSCASKDDFDGNIQDNRWKVPTMFHKALEATKTLCQYNNSETNTYGIPSLALTIGHTLKKCAMIKTNVAVCDG
jgi:hypothetical protein